MPRITRGKSAMELDKKDLEAVSRELFRMVENISGYSKRREIVEDAGRILKESAQTLAPLGSKVHHRYNTPKLTGSIRAPKGDGVKAGTYLPGNLINSIIDIADRKKKYRTYRVIIGPFYRGFRRKMKDGIYGANEKTSDGYYAHMRYGSAKAFRANVTGKALQIRRGQILQSIRINLLRYLREEQAKNKYVQVK